MSQRFDYIYDYSRRRKFDEGGRRDRKPVNPILDKMFDAFEAKTV